MDGAKARHAYGQAGADDPGSCPTFGEVIATRMWTDHNDIFIGGGTKSPTMVFDISDPRGCLERWVPYFLNYNNGDHKLSFPEQVFHNGVKGYYSNVTAIGVQTEEWHANTPGILAISLKFQPVDTDDESPVGGIVILVRFDNWNIVRVHEIPMNGIRKKTLIVNTNCNPNCN